MILSVRVAKWLRKAEETRHAAEVMRDPVAKKMMLEVATSYDRMVRYGVTLALTDAALKVSSS